MYLQKNDKIYKLENYANEEAITPQLDEATGTMSMKPEGEAVEPAEPVVPVYVIVEEYEVSKFMPNLLKDLNDLKEQMDSFTERYNAKLAEVEQIKIDLSI